MESFHNHHRQGDKAVLMGLERATQHIGHVPNHGGLICIILSDNADSIVRYKKGSSAY